jgi:glycine C-acetyltransferase
MSMSLVEKLQKRDQGIAFFNNNYGYFVYPELKGPIKNRMLFQDKEVIVWSLNDYLGLSCDEQIIGLEQELIGKYGMSYPGGSRLLSGNTEFHEKLEEELSNFLGRHCMLLNLVYVGTISILHSLLDRNDIAIYDQRVHASIQDGLKGHTGKKVSFRHNNVEHLRLQLKKATELKGRDDQIFVIVDGVYSMSGELAPLPEIVQLKQEFDFTLIVDDSHGFLLFDEGGTPQHFGVFDEVDVYISSFGKALGNVGGVVAGKKEIISYFKYNLRSQIFGRSLSVVHVLSVLEKLYILKSDLHRRDTLWRNTTRLQTGFKEHGFDLGKTASPITPIFIKCPLDLACRLVISLREKYGIFCSGVVYPVIPKNEILLRLVVTSLHTEEDISRTLTAFSSVEANLKNETDQISSSQTLSDLVFN